MSTLQLRLSIVLLCVAAALSAGCNRDDGMGQVSGAVKFDGQIPPAGSSITFFPLDGKSQSAGAMLNNGDYSVPVPQGDAKVEIRIPRPVAQTGPAKQGPGADAGIGQIVEALPPKYNDKSELRMKVVAGANKKDWEVSTKP